MKKYIGLAFDLMVNDLVYNLEPRTFNLALSTFSHVTESRVAVRLVVFRSR